MRWNDTRNGVLFQLFSLYWILWRHSAVPDWQLEQESEKTNVRSAIDAAYFALSRFAAINAGALVDYGGKTNIAFCQACGRAFIKRGNRQKYCGTMQCQSIRDNRKSSDYYYRKKK